MNTAIVAAMSANGLLNKLREADRHRLAEHVTLLDLTPGDVLQNAGDDVCDTWFPLDHSMAAFCVWIDSDRTPVEVALIGREGAVGGIVSNGRLPAYATSVVRAGGRFLRIKTAALEQAKLDSIALRHWFSRYSDCMIAQVFQTAACNASHTIAQRTAKWLLSSHDRTGIAEIPMTHDQLAGTLGVGRTFVTRVVGQLRDQGVIATRRGSVVILDEAALRHVSCHCADDVQSHYQRVLDGLYD